MSLVVFSNRAMRSSNSSILLSALDAHVLSIEPKRSKILNNIAAMVRTDRTIKIVNKSFDKAASHVCAINLYNNLQWRINQQIPCQFIKK